MKKSTNTVSVNNALIQIKDQVVQLYQKERADRKKIKYINNIFYNKLCNMYSNVIHYNKKISFHVKINKNINKCVEFLLNNGLIVSPADKNLGLTVIPKDWYISELEKYIYNQEIFHKERIDYEKIKKNHDKCFIVEKGQFIYNYILNLESTPKIPKVYILPKIHKCPSRPIDINLVKSRYITPNSGWINTKASTWLAKELQKYVIQIPWIVESSLDFQNKLANSKFADCVYDGEIVIITADIKEMYPSISHNLAKQTIKFVKDKLDKNLISAKWEVYELVLDWIFDTSFVEYKNETFKQIKGLPMGNPVSPVIANLTLAMLEFAILTQYNIRFCMDLYRFLDDVIVFVNTSQHDAITIWKVYIQLFNEAPLGYGDINIIELLQTGIEINPGEGDGVTFLDLKLSWDSNKNLIIENFDKPMNKHIYTDPNTFYPESYIYNWIHCENVRLIRNCSNSDLYNKNVNQFIEFLKRRNYSINKINKQLSITNYDDRNKWMTKKVKEKSDCKYMLIRNDENRPIINKVVPEIIKAVNRISNSNLEVRMVTTKGNSILNELSRVRKNI